MKDSLDQAHIAGMRWTILRTLMVGGHMGATDKMCLDVCRAEYIGVTMTRVRTEMDYLEVAPADRDRAVPDPRLAGEALAARQGLRRLRD